MLTVVADLQPIVMLLLMRLLNVRRRSMNCDKCGKHIMNMHIEPFDFGKKVKIVCNGCYKMLIERNASINEPDDFDIPIE